MTPTVFKATDCLVRLHGTHTGPLARQCFGASAIREALKLVNGRAAADVWCHWFEDGHLVMSTSRLRRKVRHNGTNPELLVIDIETAPAGRRPRTILRPVIVREFEEPLRKIAA